MVAMNKIIILKGLPASGKSTYARTLVDTSPEKYKRINKDDLRLMLDNGRYSKRNEKFVIDTRNELIGRALIEGFDVIVDDTNLNPVHEQDIRRMFPSAQIEIVTMSADLEECIRRDEGRHGKSGFVGEKVIRDMHDKWLKKKDERYYPKTNTPVAIICDIDGTLAKMSDRKPYDWMRVGEDSLVEPVRFMLQCANDLSVKIIVVSGRDAVCRDLTVNWLLANGVPFDELYMRPEGNNEKDVIIKRRIFDEKLRDRFTIKFVLDDRNQVVEMWRGLGLLCCQVADGNF